MIEAPAPLVATRVGWWLGQALRVTAAALLLAGLLGAALAAARPSSWDDLGADLAAGRVTELTFETVHPLGPTVDDHPEVRWRVAGAGWRTARLDSGAGPGWDLPGGDVSRAEAAVRERAARAGVPVSLGPRAPATLLRVGGVTSILLVLLLIGGPRPRRATKWAWFWVSLVPGCVGQLVWLVVEAPWSSRANRRPEPPPGRPGPEDGRLRGGPAFLLALAATLALAVVTPYLAGWLAS